MSQKFMPSIVETLEQFVCKNQCVFKSKLNLLLKNAALVVLLSKVATGFAFAEN